MGRAIRSTSTPLEMGSWWVDVFSFSHINVLGPTTCVFDDVGWGSDALAAKAAPSRTLCDVHLKSFGGAATMAV
jgi:hypothetical protein